MIVVDANILVYHLVECPRTDETRRLRERDPDWKFPPLWEYEFGNAVSLMILQGLQTGETAGRYFELAKKIFKPLEIPSDTGLALRLAAGKGISFYDAQYLALAETLAVPLVTEDKALRRASGGLALSLREALAG